MRNTQLLASVGIIIALFMIVTPAQAQPKTIYPFEQEIHLFVLDFSPGRQMALKNMLLVAGAESSGVINAIGIDLSGTFKLILSGSYNTKTGTGTFYGNWEIMTSTIDGFSGNLIGKTETTTDSSLFHIEGIFVGTGEGIYSKDRIIGSFEGYMAGSSLSSDLKLTGTFKDVNS